MNAPYSLKDSNDSKVTPRGIMTWEISTCQTNNVPTFINKCPQEYDPSIRRGPQRICLPCIYNNRKLLIKCCTYYVEINVSKVGW